MKVHVHKIITVNFYTQDVDPKINLRNEHLKK